MLVLGDASSRQYLCDEGRGFNLDFFSVLNFTKETSNVVCHLYWSGFERDHGVLEVWELGGEHIPAESV